MFSDRTNWKLAQNRLTQALEKVRASGGRIFDLTISNPTRVGLEYDSAAILAALGSANPTPSTGSGQALAAKSAARIGHPALDYDPQAKGLREAREAVAGYYRGDHRICDLDLERIVLTTSTSEGYSYVFRLLCNAGDELLVPKPSYPLFEFLADLQDVKLVPYPLIYDHGWQMDFPSLEKAVTARTRGVVVVHPNNPTGSYVKPGERELLNAFCRERGLALIVDEVFLDYGLDEPLRLPGLAKARSVASSEQDLYRGTPSGVPNRIENQSAFRLRGEDNARSLHAPVDRLEPIHRLGRDDRAGKDVASFVGNREVLTFTLSGLSKISALPQMKVAWIVTSGPEEQVATAMARLEVVADTYLSMNAPVQWAVPVLMEQRKSIQRQLLARVQANLAELDRQLAGQKACQRLEVEGGWYAVLRVPVTRSDEELAIELLREKQVLVHPGHFYDFPSDGYLVVSLIGVEEEFGEGIGRVLEYLSCQPPTESGS